MPDAYHDCSRPVNVIWEWSCHFWDLGDSGGIRSKGFTAAHPEQGGSLLLSVARQMLICLARFKDPEGMDSTLNLQQIPRFLPLVSRWLCKVPTSWGSGPGWLNPTDNKPEALELSVVPMAPTPLSLVHTAKIPLILSPLFLICSESQSPSFWPVREPFPRKKPNCTHSQCGSRLPEAG